MKEAFIAAIHSKKKFRLTFYSIEDRRTLVHTIAPLDFSPSREAKAHDDRFHCWDYDGDAGRQVLSLLQHQIVTIKALPDTFDPAEFVTWSTADSPWFIARDWDVHS